MRHPFASIPKCRRALESFGHGASGSVAVEFAFVAPILFIILWACVDYGQVIEENMRLLNAATAGVQYAAANSLNAADPVSIQAVVRTAASDAQGTIAVASTLACSCEDGSVITCGTGTCPSGIPILLSTITATENFTVTIPTPFFTSAVPLSATAAMRVVR